MQLPFLKKDSKKNESAKLKSSLSLTQTRISAHLVIWLIFAVVIVLELFLLYKHLYKNLVFEETAGRDPAAAVRINFDHYNKVTQRLDSVTDFKASTSIDFSGKKPSTGRSNPFAQPE